MYKWDDNTRPGIFRGVYLDDGVDRQSSTRAGSLFHLPENLPVTDVIATCVPPLNRRT